MDWQLIEVGIVTTLAMWVFLFSPSNTSRLVAGIVFFANLVWVLFEPEQGHRKTPRAPIPSSDRADSGTSDTAETEPPPRII